MTGPSSKFATTLGRLQQPDAPVPETPQTGKPASGEVGKQGSGQASTSAPSPDERGKYTTILPKALVKAVQRHAFEHELKDYAVVEQALREFLERQGD